jgi:hypothetical protein
MYCIYCNAAQCAIDKRTMGKRRNFLLTVTVVVVVVGLAITFVVVVVACGMERHLQAEETALLSLYFVKHPGLATGATARFCGDAVTAAQAVM